MLKHLCLLFVYTYVMYTQSKMMNADYSTVVFCAVLVNYQKEIKIVKYFLYTYMQCV